MTYNTTQLANSLDLFDLITYANESTTGILFGLFIVSLFLVMTMGFIKFGFEKALFTASFIAFIISAIMSYSGFLTIIYPLAFLAVTAFTGLYMFVVVKE